MMKDYNIRKFAEAIAKKQDEINATRDMRDQGPISPEEAAEAIYEYLCENYPDAAAHLP